ncbi:MAG: tetratricopeptide repeat protein [Candidatus Sungbacteria bacterium]|nr:tetratricopeptide repeat protein [Candidatus Sungbacteria bacterium]
MEYQTVNYFERGVKYLLYVLAAMIPLWFMPLHVAAEFGREITFGILIFAATLLWFLGVLTKGNLRLPYSIILLLSLALVVAVGISTVFSRMPMSSLLYADPIAERYLTLIEGVLLMVLAGSVLRGKKDAENIGIVLAAAGLVAGLVNIVQLIFGISVWGKLSAAAGGVNFSVAGSMNSTALFYAVLLAAMMGFLTGSNISGWRKYIFGAGILVFLANLFLINYINAWIVLLIVSILLIGINFRGAAGNREYRFSWKYAVGTLFTALAIVMIMIRTPIIGNLDLPAEVSPSLGATINVAKSVFEKSPRVMLFGTGPGTFGFDWLQYKDRSINQTPFWSVRFDQGYSWVATLLVTTGVAGALLFAAFLLVSLLIFLRSILFSDAAEHSSSAGYFLGFAGFAAVAFLYPANVTFLFGLFFFAGICMHQLSIQPRETAHAGASASFLDIREKNIRFEGPWAMFLSSLVTIFALVLSVAALYMQTVRLNTALLIQSGVEAFNRGDTTRAVASLVQAVQVSEDAGAYEILLQARMEEVKKLIERASRGENVQQEFQSSVSLAVQAFQRALSLESGNPALWRMQGAFYELLIPFIDGSQRFAFDSYKKATEFDPSNPSVYTDLGRAHLVYADRLTAIINQGAADRDTQVREKEQILKDAVSAFERAIDAKGDFASAYFLLAQASLRMGNIEKAIKSVEGAKLAAPFDIGVAFQLGLLYYQTNDLGRARSEFERAVSISDSYSNARYFLGLIYDSQGDKTKAIEQFAKIEQLNPDNQEIKKIAENLRAGKPALDGISPPNEAPEKRKDAPVKK